MNKYTKHVWKRNILAFLIAAGVLLLVISGTLLLTMIVGEYLPYVVVTISGLTLVYLLSIPIKDVLEEIERDKYYQRFKDEERKKNNWKPF